MRGVDSIFDLVLIRVCRFRSVKFLLTDSQVPRDTKKLVANVATRLKEVRALQLSIHETDD